MNKLGSASPVPMNFSINFWIASFHAKPATNANAVVINPKIVSMINFVTSFAMFYSSI